MLSARFMTLSHSEPWLALVCQDLLARETNSAHQSVSKHFKSDKAHYIWCESKIRRSWVCLFLFFQLPLYRLDAPQMMSVLSVKLVGIGLASILASKKIPAAQVLDAQFLFIKQLAHAHLAPRVIHLSDVFPVSLCLVWKTFNLFDGSCKQQ
jgi:hypothetical protein